MATKASTKERPISVGALIDVIRTLKADEPYRRRNGYVATTKDQWLGWLSEYDKPGYYDRKGTGYDARFAYNHVQTHQVLIWLLGAAGLEAPKLVEAAAAADVAKSMAQKAASVRKLVPWERAVELLWPNDA